MTKRIAKPDSVLAAQVQAAAADLLLKARSPEDVIFNNGWWDGIHAADGHGRTTRQIVVALDQFTTTDRDLYVRALIAGIREGDRRRGAEAQARWSALHPDRRETVGMSRAGLFRIVRLEQSVEGNHGLLVSWIYEPADWPEDRSFGGSYDYEEGAFAVAQALEDQQLRDERG